MGDAVRRCGEGGGRGTGEEGSCRGQGQRFSKHPGGKERAGPQRNGRFGGRLPALDRKTRNAAPPQGDVRVLVLRGGSARCSSKQIRGGQDCYD